jgi:fatty-acyl-CoA synthase
MPRTKIGSVGKPQVLAEVRIVGADGRDVARGEQGELWFRGPRSRRLFTRTRCDAQGVRIGRLAALGRRRRQDADGYYFIVDRIKDMYISGGENVYPRRGRDRAARASRGARGRGARRADERWGEVGHAVVPLPPRLDARRRRAARACARESRPPTKSPSTSPFVDDFPRTAAGKVQKHVLRALVAGKA